MITEIKNNRFLLKERAPGVSVQEIINSTEGKIIVPDDAILLSKFRTHIGSVRPFYLMSNPRTNKIIKAWSGKYFGEFMKKETVFKMYSDFDEKYIIYTNRLKSRNEEIKSLKQKQDGTVAAKLAKILKIVYPFFDKSV